MSLNELGQYPKKVSETYHFNTVNQEVAQIGIETEPVDKNNFNSDKLESNHPDNTVIFIAPILLGLTTAAIIYRRLNRVKQVNLPCKNCQFFSHNSYLKCAVNPADVMTKKATDCREYCPQPKKLFGFSWKPRDKN